MPAAPMSTALPVTSPLDNALIVFSLPQYPQHPGYKEKETGNDDKHGAQAENRGNDTTAQCPTEPPDSSCAADEAKGRSPLFGRNDARQNDFENRVNSSDKKGKQNLR